jgi:hypothetical protein
VYQLGGLVQSELAERLEAYGSYFVDLVVEGQFVGKALEEVARSLKSILSGSGKAVAHSICSATIQSLLPPELPLKLQSGRFDTSDIAGFVSKRFDLHNQSLLVLYKPGRGIAIVAVRSSTDDDVIGHMYKQLKRGARQFSGSRPGILCAHFLDLTPDQIMNLYRAQKQGEPSGLNLMATRLFKEKRPFLYSVHYSSPGPLSDKQEKRGNILRHHVRESGLSYTFVNPNHPDAATKALEFF